MNTQSLHEYVIESLEASKGSWPAIAESTGISYRTIEKIGRRIVVNPGVSYVERLAHYFRSRETAA
jgi:hypothetical protein